MTDDTLAHYGTPRHSGRYEWGSGKDPYQDGLHFMSVVQELKRDGLSDTQISKALGFESTSDYRARHSISSVAVRKEKQRQVMALADKGMSDPAIGRQLNLNESSVRALKDPIQQARANRFEVTGNILKDGVEKYRYVDIGKGTENHLGISDTQLKTTVAILKQQGYKVQYTNVIQAGTGLTTSLKVLTKADVTGKELYANRDKIRSLTDHIDPDTGDIVSLKPPKNISADRIGVVYGPDGGADNDGMMYIRPGVADVGLGDAQYAQVRVAVDGTHYIKGMAMYRDDLPKGVDILFNTTKKDTGNKLDALKPIKEDADPLNPFGSMTRQKTYKDAQGNEHQSILNIVNEEGDWYNWSNKFSSQFLSKQTPELAKTQLDLTTNSKKQELEEILALTNPAVKRKLLETFADSADSKAVDLKATGLPRTATHVIIPINSLKDTEVYAPKYNNGETVVLVRHPHGGIFEIPQLTVNNSNKEARRSINGAKDAIGINANVAARLSGADFDGDTVLVIPNGSGKVKISAPLEALKNFSPKDSYSLPPNSGRAINDAKNPDGLKQQLMGDVSNLITDMTLKGAHQNEIARAVKHSMVVIDAQKHDLDYRASAVDQQILELKRKYQGGANKGASTLISRTTSDKSIPQRRKARVDEGGAINPETGEVNWVPTGKSFVNKQGETIVNKTKVAKGALTNDANTLVSDNGGTRIEQIYAQHANTMKALANQARKASLSIENIPYDKSAKAAYAPEVASLNAKLDIAERNAPKERQAQLLANAIVKAKLAENPSTDKAQLKKLNGLALTEARARTDAGKTKIDITDKEWNAIQSGAFTASRLAKIIGNSDIEAVKERATPKSTPAVNASALALARSMQASGYTMAEISDRLGLSTSTLYKALE